MITRNNRPFILSSIFLSALSLAALMGLGSLSAQGQTPRFRHVGSAETRVVRDLPQRMTHSEADDSDEVLTDKHAVTELDSLLPRSVGQILASLPASYPYNRYALRAAGPWVISGYRPLPARTLRLEPATLKSILGRSATTHDLMMPVYEEIADSLVIVPDNQASNGLYLGEEEDEVSVIPERKVVGYEMQYSYLSDDDIALLPPVVKGEYLPSWLREAMNDERIQDDGMYRVMMLNPYTIEYARWDLPEPPRLPDDDPTFLGFLRKLNIPEIDPGKAVITEEKLGKVHWLHTFNTGLQFSQSYFSRNWYQGGTNHLALLFNFLWEVNLNQVFHPNLMLQSVLSYKLGLNTTPRGSMHKYQINTDIFQWNFKTGVRAFTNWFYSFNAQFKTQMFRNYPSDSEQRTASFLSPGELNMGLGMTFNHTNKKNTFKLSLSISPLSYNLKTCIDPDIDPTQFKITPPAKALNEIGSNIEGTYEWNILSNVTWRSRVFAFTDYSSLQGDWENTFDFAISRFLSTQFYFHLRYDSSTPNYYHTGWGKWQFKEFLSIGLSYTFSTKP